MTTKNWLCGAALALILAAPAGLRAQQTPEQVVRAYYGALREGNVSQVADLTHPQALEAFKTFVIGFVEGMGGAADEDMPITVEEMRRLPADSVYQVFMAGVGEGLNQEEARSLLADMEVQVMGQVARGDSMMYVVYDATSSFMGTRTTQTMVLTLRRDGREWRVDPGEGLMNMMGAGVFSLMMSAAMQAGMAEGMMQDN